MCRYHVLPTKQRDHPCFENAHGGADINSEGGTFIASSRVSSSHCLITA
ncbi:hypothetical protein shim_38290 [Shimia sp. SK013]|nr:hypothetical protein shim_38290 [Shimia sp. SK013]